MAPKLDRATVFPEAELPDAASLLAEGRKMAETVKVGPSPFLKHYNVSSEAEYKRQQMEAGRVMMHAQIGFRDPAKSRRAYAEVWEKWRRAG